MPMRRPSGFTVFLFSMAISSCVSAERDLPLHPTLIYAEYQGARHLVVSAKGNKPVVEIGGERRTLDADTELFTERTANFGERSAKLEGEQEIKLQRLELGSPMPGAPREHAGFRFEATVKVTSEHDLRDCYVAIVSYDEEWIMDEYARKAARKTRKEIRPNRAIPAPRLSIQEVGNLKAGKAKTVTLKWDYRTGPIYVASLAIQGPELPIKTIFPLFSGGREIRSPASDAARAYFYKREEILHAAVLERWLKQNVGSSRPLQAMLQIPPLFESNTDLPAEIVAILSIASDGTVIDAQLDGELAPSHEKTLLDTLHAWLFLPKLENGTAVPTKVGVPLRF